MYIPLPIFLQPLPNSFFHENAFFTTTTQSLTQLRKSSLSPCVFTPVQDIFYQPLPNCVSVFFWNVSWVKVCLIFQSWMDSEKKNVKILRIFSYIYQNFGTSFIFTSLFEKFYGQKSQKIKFIFIVYDKNKKVCQTVVFYQSAKYGPSLFFIM